VGNGAHIAAMKHHSELSYSPHLGNDTAKIEQISYVEWETYVTYSNFEMASRIVFYSLLSLGVPACLPARLTICIICISLTDVPESHSVLASMFY
jgi:hypothetical protein